MTVLVWGSPSDPPVALVLEALSVRGADIALIDPDDHSAALTARFDGSRLDGGITIGRRTICLDRLSGAYLRPFGLAGSGDSSIDRDALTFHDALVDLTEALALSDDGAILNPMSAMSSNMSKPYQAQIIVAEGFSTPTTIVTDDVEELRTFLLRFPDAIFKSASGVRSIVSPVVVDDAAALERLKWCPVQFQERVAGYEVRVHVVGDRTLAARVRSDALDYRYALAQVGRNAELEVFDLPSDVAERCVRLAGRLRLPLAGIDLKFCDDGRVVCFEANPSPGFSYFELSTGLPIAAAIADRLMSGRLLS